MSWVWISHFVKTDKNSEQVKEIVAANKKHWEEVALDIGLDPTKNVFVQENETHAVIGISEDFDSVLREEAGDWRGEGPGSA